MGVPFGVPLRRDKAHGGARAGADLSTSDVDIFIPTNYDGFIATIQSISIIRDDWEVCEVIPDPIRIAERRDRYGRVFQSAQVSPGTLDNDLAGPHSLFQIRTFKINVPEFSDPLKIDIVTTSRFEFDSAQDVIMANMFTMSGKGESIRDPLGVDGSVVTAASVSPFQDTIDELHNHCVDPVTGRSFLLPTSSILFPAQHVRMDCCDAHRDALKPGYLLKRLERFVKALRAGIIPIHGKKMGTKGKTLLVTTWDHLDISLTPTELAQYKDELCPISQVSFDELEPVDEFHGERPVVLTHTKQLFSLEAFTAYVQSEFDSRPNDPIKCPSTRKFIK